MKKHGLLLTLVICCGYGLMQSPAFTQGRVLTAAQLTAIVTTNIASCTPPSAGLKSGLTQAAAIIPTNDARTFPKDRVERTLNGIWRGQVIGDDGHVGVDYYWITDIKRGEGLVIAQRSGKESVAAPRAAAAQIAPKFTYLMCAHEGYYPSKDTPQIHEFTKVSDDLTQAPRIVEESTGLKVKKAQPTVSELWQGLVAERYFSDPRFADKHGNAYAGGLFKPYTIAPIANAVGPAQISIKWNAEYRGGGSTSVVFTPDVPVLGVEYAQFVGTTTSSGDYLVSSPGNGRLWKVEAVKGGKYDLAFDKVVIGPLAK